MTSTWVQEAERVMDTFKNHLHLPVTKIDHSEVMLNRLKVCTPSFGTNLCCMLSRESHPVDDIL